MKSILTAIALTLTLTGCGIERWEATVYKSQAISGDFRMQGDLLFRRTYFSEEGCDKARAAAVNRSKKAGIRIWSSDCKIINYVGF